MLHNLDFDEYHGIMASGGSSETDSIYIIFVWFEIFKPF